MTTSAQVAAFEHEARAIPGLPDEIQYLPDDLAIVTGLVAKYENGVATIQGSPNYTVNRRIALHEFGHLWHFAHRDQQTAFWQARFGTCATAPKSWAEAYGDAHPGGAIELWPVLPGETIAECFAVAVEGSGKERTLDYGCTVDRGDMRAFFGYVAPVSVAPVIEWVGPAATGNFMSGRSGNPVALIIDHWTTGSLASALSRFQQVGEQVSAHYIVGAFGRVVQVVKDEDTAFHAGDFPVNLISIGIEHECGPTMPPTDVLYASSVALHRYLAQKYQLDLEVGVTVKRHNNIVPTQCPGTLDVERIVREAGGGEEMTDQDFVALYERLIKPGVDATLNAMKAVETKTVVAVRAAGDILTKTNL